MEFFGLILLAVIVEGIISYTKAFFVDGKFQWQVVAAIAIGVFLAIVYQIDLFSIVGLSARIPLVGNILTGILISRGSNYIFDLIKTLQTQKDETQS
ncbi:MAG: hypothetical protein Q8865_03705 [Bacillota bacterium]|nr:hypothetical protein [Bacillota bacterium]